MERVILPAQDEGVPPDLLFALYQLAAQPAGVEDFLHRWDGWISAAAPLPGPDLSGLARHAALALELLQRCGPPAGTAAAPDPLAGYSGVAAFVTDNALRITAVTAAAEAAFGLAAACGLEDLPLDPPDLSRLRTALRLRQAGRGTTPMTLRLRHQRTGAPLIVRLIDGAVGAAPPCTVIVAQALYWPQSFASHLREAYGLSATEAEITHALCRGETVQSISGQRGRSAETVRTQLRTILTKTETRSQAALIRSTLTLLQAAVLPDPARPPPRPAARPAGVTHPAVAQDLLPLPGGRSLHWQEFGCPAGQPVVYLASDWGLTFWPAAASRTAAAQGLRVIVPLRPGYGRSTPGPAGADHADTVTSDLIALAGHLGLSDLPVMTQGADLRFALNCARKRPDLIRMVLACAPLLPSPDPLPGRLLQSWPRWLRNAARTAPQLTALLTHAGLPPGDDPTRSPLLAGLITASTADRQAWRQAEVRAALTTGLSGSLLCPGARGADTLAAGLICAEKDWRDLLYASRVPLQMIRGAEDPWSHPQACHDIARHRPRTSLTEIAGAGHLVLFSHWRDCLRRLLTAAAQTAPCQN